MESLGLDNRRIARRVSQHIDVELYGDDMRMIQGQTINLSATGARVFMRNDVEGAHFHLKINVNGRNIQALADKVWESRNENSGCVVLGLRFISLNARDHQRLTHYCDSKAQRAAESKRPRRIKLS